MAKLAKQKKHLDTQTCCPNCQTIFEVSPELLASSDTRVRCGECLSIFDSLVNLRHEKYVEEGEDFLTNESGNEADEDAASLPISPDDAIEITDTGDHSIASDTLEDGAAGPFDGQDLSDLDATYSDFDLFSGEAELPEVAYFDQTQAADHMRFDESDGDDTLDENIFAHDYTQEPAASTAPIQEDNTSAEQILAQDVHTADVDYLTDDVPRDPLQFNYREPEPDHVDFDAPALSGARSLQQPDETVPRKTTPLPGIRVAWVKRSLLALLLVVIAAALYGYRYRTTLLQNPDIRSFIQTVCAPLGCELQPLVDLDSLRVVKRTVYSHPTIANALVIDLAFINQAAFSQPYPILEIRLTNRNGGLVVRNSVEPADYLDDWQTGDLLTVGQRLDVNLTVEDPGQTATSFELKFR